LLFPAGVSGVLHRPDPFDSRISDHELVKPLCPKDDDSWFYWMQRMTGTTAYLLSCQTRVLE
jgi:hypothetical protein